MKYSDLIELTFGAWPHCDMDPGDVYRMITVGDKHYLKSGVAITIGAKVV